MMDEIKIKNIFAAVNNKSVLDPLLKLLDKKSVNIWGTEGTVKYLKSKGFKAASVVSGFDFDGRLKSISREVFARILADRSKKKHLAELKRLNPRAGQGLSSRIRSARTVLVLNTEPIDLVIVDLYKLEKKNFPESMDIGGQALIRAAIKNYKSVSLAFDASSLESLESELIRSKGSTNLDFRKIQAKKAAKFIAQRAKLESDLF